MKISKWFLVFPAVALCIPALSTLSTGCSSNTPSAPVTVTQPVTVIIVATPLPTPAAGVSWATGGSLGVAVSGSNVFVGDYSTSLEVYTLTGTPVTTLGLGVYASGILPDGSGGVYVAGSCNNTVIHFDSAFASIGGFSTANCSNGIAADASGNLYLTDGLGTSNQIQKYSSAGVSLASWTVQDGNPWGIAIAGSPQTVFVASLNSHTVYTYSLTGTQLPLHWTIAGDGASLGVDGLGRIFTGGYGSAAPIQRFDLGGNYQMQWGSFTSEGIAFDGSNDIYIGSGASIQAFGP